MIKTLEKTARTEDDAIAAALAELGLDREDVHVEILERAKSGFLGIGASPAVIRVSYEVPDEPKPVPPPAPVPPAPKAAARPPKGPKEPREPRPPKAAGPAPKAQAPAPKPPVPAPEAAGAPAAPVDENADCAAVRDFLTGLLERMGVKAQMEIGLREDGGIKVELSGTGMGAIIGRRGETLDAIQHLTNYVVNRGSEKHVHVSVDAESYRSKREESLVHLAEKMAEKAIKYKRSMALEPMNSYERHVIHTALQNYEGVTTSSTGTEPNRRVVVSYVRPEQPAGNKPQSREWA